MINERMKQFAGIDSLNEGSADQRRVAALVNMISRRIAELKRIPLGDERVDYSGTVMPVIEDLGRYFTAIHAEMMKETRDSDNVDTIAEELIWALREVKLKKL